MGKHGKYFETADTNPIVARLIRDEFRRTRDFVPHERIAALFQADSMGARVIDAAMKTSRGDVSEKWLASNIVQWFSALYTRELLDCRNEFTRQKQKRKWAYRPAGTSVNEQLRQGAATSSGVNELPPSSKGKRPTVALAVRQPYAELILVGKKRFEYRSVRTKKRERVYIYAAKQPLDDIRAWRAARAEPGTLPVGVIVGSVEITNCAGRDGEYSWKLANPQRAKRAVKPKRMPQPIFFRPF